MTAHVKYLASRRRDLQERCALQRQQLGQLSREVETRLVFADRMLGIAMFVAQRPIIIIAAVAGTLLLGPWRVLRWVSHGAILLSAARKVQQLIRW
jgi:hypothetical protein